ncbi:hypothetical protein GPECTOR_35g841 [Gonium pectorale]|uniref:DNA repair metallo-beta-lactamase domain-containing protein n=1 Tax=Gonium pectorale TaxID=33097 RepID=A0A150GCA8_GONPE|nr:hypothetical protein GPECTOR_35g841 [Gonium pectorale]|eukprot:KXZ47403.1 hypothetical protein GPECTOR_35g841 [Gonium pectorale]
MRQQLGLAGVRVDTLFLDTTYAAPKHTHPPQQEAINMMVQAMRDALAEEPRTLFLLAAYHIGKERCFLGAAQQLGAKVWCSDAKRSVLRLLDLPPELMALLVTDPRDAAIHVTGWGLQPDDIQAYMAKFPGVWQRAMGIRPTGKFRVGRWTYRRSGGLSVRRQGDVSVLGVPYSEHSSWADLCDAVAQLRPRRLVPTVNAATPAKRRALVDLFAHLMDLSADRSRLDVYLLRGGGISRPAALRPRAADACKTPCAGGPALLGGFQRGPGATMVTAWEVVDLSGPDAGEELQEAEDPWELNPHPKPDPDPEVAGKAEEPRQQRLLGHAPEQGRPSRRLSDELGVQG